MDKLDIPILDNPTRQKIWRVVVFAAPLVLAALVSMLLVRAYITVDTLSAFAPAGTVMSLRVIKTPETSAVLEEQFHGTLLFPNAPYTVDELSRWSKRGSVIFLGETGIIGVAIAGKVPESVQTEAAMLGFQVIDRFGGTFIGTETPDSTRFAPRLPLLTMLPWYNGEAYQSAVKLGAPMRLTDHSLTITRLGRSANVSDTATDQSITKIAVSSSEAQMWLGFDVPLVFPGLRALEEQMMKHGFSLSLGQDAEGTPYSIAVPEGSLTTDDMENAVSELYYTKTLVEAPSEDVYTSMDEIVSDSTARPVTTSDPSATITSITDNSGVIVRAAQTAHSLVLTNRPAEIASAASSSILKNPCLGRANQWISISGLSSLLPEPLSTPGMTLIRKLLEGKQIAFSNHHTRVCW